MSHYTTPAVCQRVHLIMTMYYGGQGRLKLKAIILVLSLSKDDTRSHVGAVGLEPTTSWSQTMRASQLRHAP